MADDAAAAEQEQQASAPAPQRQRSRPPPDARPRRSHGGSGGRGRQQKSIDEQIAGNGMVRDIARTAGREIIRGLFGTARRRR